MFLPDIKGSDLGSLELSRIERKSLYLMGFFLILATLFSAFTIASAIINNVSLIGSLEKALLVFFAAATALVAMLLDYWIDRKATSSRDKRPSLVSAARLLFLGALFGAAVCLAVIIALTVGPIENIYLSALVGTPLCTAGIFGFLFGKLFWARIAKQAYVTADDKSRKKHLSRIHHPRDRVPQPKQFS